MAVTHLSACLSLLLLLLLTPAHGAEEAESSRPRNPIVLDRTGGFSVGGRVISSPLLPNTTLSCDWGYMEYFIPYRPRSTSIVMWHSSSTQVWQNNWAGGEGFKDIFLRLGYPVYLWDGPRVGRANWACNSTFYTPDYRDQGNFVAWNFGPRFGDWWPGVQFPTEDENAWAAATRTRYVEYDTPFNVDIETDAAVVAADSGRLGSSIVYLTNSASGMRAMLTAAKSNTSNIKAIVNYETIGLLFPDDAGVETGPGPFDPYIIPAEQFNKLTELKVVQMVWGDNRNDTFQWWNQSVLVHDLINERGGNSEFVKLGDDEGLEGSTHSAFADLDNHKVAKVLEKMLRKYRLDGWARRRRWLEWW